MGVKRKSISGGLMSVHSHKRKLVRPEDAKRWSMTTLREKLIKIVRHGPYVTFQVAEMAVPRELFRKILHLIDRLRPVPLPP